jgi:type I restriction enzyme S subunit
MTANGPNSAKATSGRREHPWPRVPLGELLCKSGEAVALQVDKTYKEITVRLWGRGVALRGERLGGDIAGKTRNVVRRRQFVFSRIDARNGAFGLVPDELDGAVVSSDFPVFNMNEDRLIPEFLDLYAKRRSFAEEARRVSKGTTNRVRLREDGFYRLTIPLPPLPEQKRIVAKVQSLASKIDEARELREGAAAEAAVLIRAASRRLFGDEPARGWVPLSAFVSEIENGRSPQCLPFPAEIGNWGVLKVGAVSFGAYDPRENKALPLGLPYEKRYEVKPGDFLMCRANTKELVGACAIVKKTPPHLLLSDKTFRFHWESSQEVSVEWIDAVLKSPALRHQIEAAASGTSPTMKNISKAKVLALRLPPHDRRQQAAVVKELEHIRDQVAAIVGHQKSTGLGISALTPSILDRAFRGQL